MRPETSVADQALLSVEGLSAFYGAAQILFDVDLQVRPGEVVALMGRNGAGKSTTLKSIMGLVARRQGSVLFNGERIDLWPTHRIAQAGVGFVPEDRRIFTELTVMENLEVGRQSPRVSRVGRTEQWTVDELFALFPNLATMRDRLGGQMSGGEQQMLTIARTLMGNPSVLLLDEPSEGVAPLIVEAMAKTVLDLKRRGLGILLSEQNLRFTAMLADWVYVLEGGQVRHSGAMESFMAQEDLRVRWLGV